MIHAEPFVIHASTGEVITIKALGDIHHLQKASDEDRLISDILDRPTKQTFYISMGDSLDSIGGRANKYFSPMSIKDKFLTGEKPPLNMELDDLCRIYQKYTKPSQWIGHISGNHPLMLMDNGLDLMQNLCATLKHRYLGYQAYVPIHIITPRSDPRYFSLMIFACHGFGGGNARWEGSALNAYIAHSARYDGWDIALYGHRHDKWIKPLARIKPHFNVKSKQRWIIEDIKLVCQTGTYLRTLSKSLYPSYSEKSGMHPRPLGCINIQFKVVQEADDDGRTKSGVKFINT